jgi:hypothetical protein
MVFCF